MKNRKIWSIVIPLGVGAAILGSLYFINSYQKDAAKPASAAATESAAPQTPEHEKAVLAEQLKKNPNHTPILMRMAELEQQSGNPAGAVPHLKQILEKEPRNEEARLELGRSLYDAGDVEGALQQTKQLVADHPNNVDGLYNLGAIYANQNQLPLARQYWMKAVEISPNSDSGRKAQDGLAKLGSVR